MKYRSTPFFTLLCFSFFLINSSLSFAEKTDYITQRGFCDNLTVLSSQNGPSFNLDCLPPGEIHIYTLEKTAVITRFDNQFLDKYNIQYRIANTDTWTAVNGLSSRTYSLTGLTPQTTYELRLQTQCSDGSTSDFTKVYTFTTLLTCDSNEPNDSQGTATVLSGENIEIEVCLNDYTDNDWYRWSYNGKTYYILVHSGSYKDKGPYRLLVKVLNGYLSIYAAIAGPVAIDSYLLLYDEDGRTLLDENDDWDGSRLSRIDYNLSVCGNMFTVSSGLWNANSIWSCDRKPNASDTIRIADGHSVTIPAGTTVNVKKIKFGNGTKIILGQGVNVKTGF